MWTIFVALSLGFACGLARGARRWRPFFQKLSTGGLFTLLIAMGVGLGSNETVMSGLAEIGISASLFSVLTVLGSLLLLLVVLPWLEAMQSPEESMDQI